MGIDIVANFYLTNFHCKKIKSKLKVTIFLLVFDKKRKENTKKHRNLPAMDFTPWNFSSLNFHYQFFYDFFRCIGTIRVKKRNLQSDNNVPIPRPVTNKERSLRIRSVEIAGKDRLRSGNTLTKQNFLWNARILLRDSYAMLRSKYVSNRKQ